MPKFKPGDVIVWDNNYIHYPTYKLVIDIITSQSVRSRSALSLDDVITTHGKHGGQCNLYEIFSLPSPGVFNESYVKLYISEEIDQRWRLITDQSIIDHLNKQYQIHCLSQIVEK